MTCPKNRPIWEKRVRRIGGALASDFYSFREMISAINSDYSPLFDLMKFNSPEQTDRAINILLGQTFFMSARDEYVEACEEKIANGKIKIERILSKRSLNKEFTSPEDREMKIKRSLRMALTRRFREIEKSFREKYGYTQRKYNKEALKICRDALSLVPGGFIIDADKFIEIYGNYLEASSSKAGKMHLEVAEAINRFFNGKVKITEGELKKYFIIEGGILKPNPKSIKIENYIRLGYRGKTNITKV